MFGWLTDKSIVKWAPATEADLPVEVQSLIAYRNSESEEALALIAGGLDKVRWDLLSDAAKGPTVWAALITASERLTSVIWSITWLTGSLTSRRFAVESCFRTSTLLRFETILID